MISNTQTLKLTKTKEAVFATVFTALAVYAPILIHYFAGVDGGRTFLPMPFFVLLAGLIFGWRVGLATAVMSPIVSYLISGMPIANILPFVTVQLAAFGIASGFLREKFNVFVSVLGSIISGWLAIGIALFFFSSMSTVGYVSSGIRSGAIGLILQLLLVPAIATLANRYFSNEEKI
jgi:hypothetical protein